MSNDLKLTQEKWNLILDLKNKVQKLEDEVSGLRRVKKALLAKNDELETKILKVNTNAAFHDIFRKT